MSAAWLFVALAIQSEWRQPAPADKHGWGLRVHTLDAHGTYLTRERIELDRFVVALINQADRPRACFPLLTARETTQQLLHEPT
jgi:hypothetical protein